MRISAGGSTNLPGEYGGVYTRIQQTENSRPIWWKLTDQVSYYISFSSDGNWEVYHDLSEFERDDTRKVSMRSVNVRTNELPFSGWEVEVGGTFVQDPLVTVNGEHFLFCEDLADYPQS